MVRGVWVAAVALTPEVNPHPLHHALLHCSFFSVRSSIKRRFDGVLFCGKIIAPCVDRCDSEHGVRGQCGPGFAAFTYMALPEKEVSNEDPVCPLWAVLKTSFIHSRLCTLRHRCELHTTLSGLGGGDPISQEIRAIGVRGISKGRPVGRPFRLRSCACFA